MPIGGTLATTAFGYDAFRNMPAKAGDGDLGHPSVTTTMADADGAHLTALLGARSSR